VNIQHLSGFAIRIRIRLMVSKLQFLIKRYKKYFCVIFKTIFGHQRLKKNSIRIHIHLKWWIWIRIRIRIQ
jgi:hypothetical protein